MAAQKFENVDDYIHSFPDDVQQLLRKIQQAIRQVIPNGDEVISYGIPTIKINGKYVLYYSAWKDHISLYPIPAGDTALLKKLEPYKAGKGTLKFPFAQPVPYDLIKAIAAEFLRERA